ncbi:alpha-2A adrenergic receptor-like [Branchiostoma lanceolatum]|uniref:alpha-2A adrenergic receptor-like n=1 Tax=Branchiostoma lanceolatum TaxID=7740 RepID=UPI003454F382
MWPNGSLNVSVADDVISLADDVISDAGDMSSEYTTGQMITIGVIVSMVMAFIIVGNVFVIVLFVFGKRIKKPRNTFIVSLAVSDVMVGATIMPFSLSNELLGYWAFGKVLCDLWLAFDVIACTASIYNLCAIALDRYWSVTDASYVQYKSRGRVKIMIAAVWISALAVGLPPLVGWAEEQDWEHTDKPFCELRSLPEYVFFSVALSFWVPLLLMVAVYCVVLRETKKRFAARLQRRKVSEEVTKRYGLRGAQLTALPDTRVPNNASKATSVDLAKGSMHKCSIMTPSTQKLTPKQNRIVLVQCPNVRDAPCMNEFSDFHLDILYEAEEMEREPKAPSSTSDNDGNNTLKVAAHDSKGNGLTNKKKMSDCENKILNTPRISGGICHDGKNSLSTEDTQEGGPCVKVGCFPLPAIASPPSLKEETRLNLVIGLVIGAFAMCWLPFFVVYPLSVVTKSLVPAVLFKFCFWLGYCNSCLNPVIYTSFNQDFHEACSEVYRKFRPRTPKGRRF